MKCPGCGNILSDQAAFCPNCNHRFIPIGNATRIQYVIVGIIAVFAVIFLASIANGARTEAPPAQPTDLAAAPQREPAPTEAPPIQARDLDAAYRENEVAADQRYQGKRVIVSGYIESIEKDYRDRPYVSIKTGQMFRNVHVYIRDDQMGELIVLKRGQAVGISGVVRGYFVRTVHVEDGVIVPVSMN